MGSSGTTYDSRLKPFKAKTVTFTVTFYGGGYYPDKVRTAGRLAAKAFHFLLVY